MENASSGARAEVKAYVQCAVPREKSRNLHFLQCRNSYNEISIIEPHKPNHINVSYGTTHDLFVIPRRIILINAAWYLDCARLGRPTNALLFITIDTPLFSTYAVDLSIDWGDYSTPIEKSYDYLSTGIRNSMPLWHTYYDAGIYEVELVASIRKSTNEAAIASRSADSWPIGRTIRSSQWTIYVDRNECISDYVPETSGGSSGYANMRGQLGAGIALWVVVAAIFSLA